MKVFRGLPAADARRPCALAIGNFDGVHLGHKLLLAKVREAATRLGIDAAVMTFQPHPREYFARLSGDLSKVPPTIANLRDKLLSFERAGMDRVIVEHFSAQFAALSQQAFIEGILVDGLQVKWLIVGADFCFGAGRAGKVEQLQQAGRRCGFEVVVLSDVNAGNMRISSSALREALIDSDFRRAAELLGQPYMISGRVIHGQKLGRSLGFPTLNLRMAQAYPALSGIFVTRVHGLDEQPLPAVSCIGTRPTVDDSGRRLLETHVFDYDRNCYGRLVKIEFLEKLRDNQKFDGLAALTDAIRLDAENARAWFRQRGRAVSVKDRI
ncbi:MAG: bifunctional riboflavin kinase/FAD synthetase [Burkholderiaceae bacterium]|nr:bifunctional riboflavin kinase/FAD synthetase [Burkholderiaceae bacterium]